MLLVVAIVLPIACNSKKNNAGSPTAARQTPLVATPTPAPQDLLTRGADDINALKGFHFVLSHENGTTAIAQGIALRKAEGDFVKPARFKGTIDGTVAGGLTINGKVISVGDSVWLAIVGDKYQPVPNGIGAAAILDPQNGVLKAVRAVNNPKYAGTDKINGVDTTIVAGTVDAANLVALAPDAQAGKMVNGKVWIGNADGHIYRVRLEGPLNDQEPANIARQIDLSRFNETVDIQPPSQ